VTKPRIGLSMLYTLSEPFNRMITQLLKTDSTYVEIVDEGKHTLNNKRILQLREIGKQKKLKLSVHAPFADINPASLSRPILKASMKRLLQSMEYAHALGAYLWVFHPGSKSGISSFYPEADWKQNLQSIRVLHVAAEDYGLRIAIENLPEKYNFLMRNPQDFLRFYKETDLDDIGIVLDTGHANLEGQIYPFLRELSEKIVHVHVSDNHGELDEHLGLGRGNIDWGLFAKTLKSSGFSGTVLTESIFNVEDTVQELRQLFS
jgi:sugar phosphate isomerase/epimerase